MRAGRFRPPDRNSSAIFGLSHLRRSGGTATPLHTPLERWIVVIGGFTQSRYSTGLSGIWLALLRFVRLDRVRITCHPWNDDWSGLAAIIERELSESLHEAPVDIVAYSWGCGHGAMTLARQLKGRGIRVRVIVSCDGVARPWLARWRAVWSPLLSRIFGEPRISVPANVDRVVFLRQRTNRPFGHEFAVENGTVLDDRGFLGKGWTHQDADNSLEFFNLAMKELT